MEESSSAAELQRSDGSRADGLRRNHVIVRASIIGIVTNLLLAGFKAGVGIESGSVAVINDAVNNLTDAVSSVVTIIGTKLADRAQRIRSARNA